MNIDEDWRAGRRYMAKEGIQQIIDTDKEEHLKSAPIIKEALIDLEARNVIYTT
jgi:hypothetical protein